MDVTTRTMYRMGHARHYLYLVCSFSALHVFSLHSCLLPGLPVTVVSAHISMIFQKSHFEHILGVKDRVKVGELRQGE
jgi:hypothetical protein